MLQARSSFTCCKNTIDRRTALIAVAVHTVYVGCSLFVRVIRPASPSAPWTFDDNGSWCTSDLTDLHFSFVTISRAIAMVTTTFGYRLQRGADIARTTGPALSRRCA